MPPRFSSLTTTSDLSFISSEPSVVTSQSGKRFFVHGDIVSDLRQYMIPGTNHLDLSAWDDDTVSRWIQFLYVGDYQIPKSVWKEKEEEEEEVEEEEEEEEEGDEQASTDRDGSNTPDTVQSRANREACENVLLLHAYLYVLAHSLGFDELERMAFDRLGSAIHSAASFIDKGASKPATDFIEMLAYTLNLPEARHYPIRLGPRGLALVKDFAATHFGNLMARSEMSSLMRKNGDFAVCLMELIANKARKAKNLWNHQIISWRSRALTAEDELRESICKRAKIQECIVAQYLDMWILSKGMEVLMNEHPEIMLEINEDLLYRHNCWADVADLRFKLWEVYGTDQALIQEFKVSKSKEIREFVNFDIKIVAYFDSCLEAADKLFRSDWSELKNCLELMGKYESSTAANFWANEAGARSNLVRFDLIEIEGRLETPLRPLELEVVKSAHMIHWLRTDSTHGIAALPVRPTTCDALEKCLFVRAAWSDHLAEWMREKIKWFEERLLSKDPSA